MERDQVARSQTSLWDSSSLARQDDLFYRQACANFVTQVDSMVAAVGRSPDFEEQRRLFDALKAIAKQSQLDTLPRHLADQLACYFVPLRGMYVAFYQELEKRAAHHIVTTQDSLEAVFRSHNDALLKQEASRARVTPESTIAFIGCGGLPWSAIALYRLCGAAVHGFDRCSELVRIGTTVVTRLGLGDGVRLYTGEGDRVDFSRFTHVFLAGMCDQKLAIVARISATLPQGGRLLIRSSRSPYQIFYPQCTQRKLPGFSFMETVSSPEADELETLVFVKK